VTVGQVYPYGTDLRAYYDVVETYVAVVAQQFVRCSRRFVCKRGFRDT
jgi:hypothetical protein